MFRVQNKWPYQILLINIIFFQISAPGWSRIAWIYWRQSSNGYPSRPQRTNWYRSPRWSRLRECTRRERDTIDIVTIAKTLELVRLSLGTFQLQLLITIEEPSNSPTLTKTFELFDNQIHHRKITQRRFIQNIQPTIHRIANSSAKIYLYTPDDELVRVAVKIEIYFIFSKIITQ